MLIYSIYKDFIRFLERMDQDNGVWESYRKYYLEPNKEFLLNYWQYFTDMGFEVVKQRVERIRKSHYSNLRSLLMQEIPEKIIKSAYGKCKKIISPPYEPSVYLIVGFFSSEGFVIKFRGKPIIGIGLERFTNFDLLDIIFAHEYAHWLTSCLNDADNSTGTLGNMLLREGLAFVFSKLVFPNKPLYKHLFFSRARLNWCIANEGHLMAIAKSRLYSLATLNLLKLGDSELEIPPRVSNYISYRLVEQYLSDQGIERLKQLFYLKDIPL